MQATLRRCWSVEREKALASTIFRETVGIRTAVFPSHTSRDRPDIVRFLVDLTLRNFRDGITPVSEFLRSRSFVLCCIGGTLTGLGSLFFDRDWDDDMPLLGCADDDAVAGCWAYDRSLCSLAGL